MDEWMLGRLKPEADTAVAALCRAHQAVVRTMSVRKQSTTVMF